MKNMGLVPRLPLTSVRGSLMGVVFELTGGDKDGKARREDVIRVLGTKGWTERAYLFSGGQNTLFSQTPVMGRL